MHRLDLLPLCGFRKDLTDADLDEFRSACQRCAAAVSEAAGTSKTPIDAALPITLLADLLKTEKDVTRLVDRLKISRAEKNLAMFMTQWRDLVKEEKSNRLKTFKDLIVDRQKEAGIKVFTPTIGFVIYRQFVSVLLLAFFFVKP